MEGFSEVFCFRLDQSKLQLPRLPRAVSSYSEPLQGWRVHTCLGNFFLYLTALSSITVSGRLTLFSATQAYSASFQPCLDSQCSPVGRRRRAWKGAAHPLLAEGSLPGAAVTEQSCCVPAEGVRAGGGVWEDPIAPAFCGGCTNKLG